jgi:hypothetical protein
MRTLALLALVACNNDPGEPDQVVDFRNGLDGGAISGERGTIKISELMWSGSVRGEGDDKVWDPTDVFLELRNEGARPINLSGWELRVQGSAEVTYVIPDSDFLLEVGDQAIVAKKSSGCFTGATWIIPELEFPLGDPFRVTLRDRDERLMESAGARNSPPFAGGYDLVSSRSMERINLMFGGRGNEPQAWHYYNVRACPNAILGDDPANVLLNCHESIPNNVNVLPECRRHTMASPGLANSPDYSGAFANGGFE